MNTIPQSLSVRTFSRRFNCCFPKGINIQSGITLILVLIFIVSLSLIAAVSMRSIGTGERVVANERDRSLAFQGAESAGREAVARISANTATSLAAGYYSAQLPRGGNADFWRTTSDLTADSTCAFTDSTRRFDWSSCAAAADARYGNSSTPTYAIERLPDVVISASASERWFRITSRAAGGSNEADVILQIMFSTP